MEDRMIDKIMNKELAFGKMKFKVVDIAFILCIFAGAFLIRWKLMPVESADYTGFLRDWMQEIRMGGGWKSLSAKISNYTSPYMYIMTLLSYISTNDLYALKLVSVFFDYVAAIAVFKILYYMTASKEKAILGMTFLLLSPTVIMDGAYWCQCDIIYTSFLLYSFYYFLQDDGEKSVIFFAISFCFKLQSVFLMPFFIIMWLKKRSIKLCYYLYVPFIYIVSALPAWIAGRSFRDLMLIYFDQSGTYPWGTLNYPNIYALLGEVMPDMRHAAEVSGAGTLMLIMMLGCVAYYIYTRKIYLTNEIMVTLALFTVALTVYSLPHMHDRYGFLVDLFAIIYGVYRVRKLPVACGFILISLLSYMPYLIAVHIIPLQYMAIALLGLIIYVGYDLYRQIQKNMVSL